MTCAVRAHADLRLRNHDYPLDGGTPVMLQLHDDAVRRGCGCELRTTVPLPRQRDEEE